MSEPLKPSAALLIKLGSTIVHLDEYTSPKGHPLDKHTADQQLMEAYPPGRSGS